MGSDSNVYRFQRFLFPDSAERKDVSNIMCCGGETNTETAQTKSQSVHATNGFGNGKDSNSLIPSKLSP
eukprot:2397640-Amphidinium_carterae.1